jgi:hypothetical protein
MDHGIPVTHGFAVDQGVEMLNLEEWQRTFPVRYLLATSVHPELVKHLRKADRPIRWFHNYLGVKDPENWTPPDWWRTQSKGVAYGYEMFLYETTWPSSAMTGYGLNSACRAACLAIWMGFKTIRIFGADCAAKRGCPAMISGTDPTYPAWLDQVQLYADGRTARHYGDKAILVDTYFCEDPACDCTPEILPSGKMRIPCRAPIHHWVTRADMVISAVHLVEMVTRFYPGRIQLMGPTLPNAMLGKPQSFFDRIPKLTGKGSISGFRLEKVALDKLPEEVAC